RTSGLTPAFASSVAVTRPLTPPPMTTTSWCGLIATSGRNREGHEDTRRTRSLFCTTHSSCVFVLFVSSWFRLSCLLPVDAQRRVPSGRAHDAAAGMRRRSAHPQVLHRRRVLRPAGHRSCEEQLLQRQLALEDVAFGEPELALEIERRQHLP